MLNRSWPRSRILLSDSDLSPVALLNSVSLNSAVGRSSTKTAPAGLPFTTCTPLIPRQYPSSTFRWLRSTAWAIWGRELSPSTQKSLSACGLPFGCIHMSVWQPVMPSIVSITAESPNNDLARIFIVVSSVGIKCPTPSAQPQKRDPGRGSAGIATYLRNQILDRLSQHKARICLAKQAQIVVH